MRGKRGQFDNDTWEAIEAVMDKTGSTFQEIASRRSPTS